MGFGLGVWPRRTGQEQVAEDRTPWQLARMADCLDPDSDTSPGAEWLSLVASAAQDIEDQDDVGEQADSLIPDYTHQRWQVFVDLAAYREDVSGLGADTSDMTQCAGVALYMIAERLLTALWEEARVEDRQDWLNDQEGAE